MICYSTMLFDSNGFMQNRAEWLFDQSETLTLIINTKYMDSNGLETDAEIKDKYTILTLRISSRTF